MFNNISYKQKDGVAIGSPIGHVMANIFASFYEMTWFEQCPTRFLQKIRS